MINIASFRFNDFLENTWLIYDDTRECMIIDPGMYTLAERDCIDEYMNYLGLQLTRVLVTHAHLDHILGCSYLLNKYGIPLVIHEKEYKNLKLMQSYAFANGYDIDQVSGDPVLVAEGDVVKFGNSQLDVLFTPGHSQGSISFINKQQGIIFSGDVVYNNSIGRADLPGGNLQTLLSTIANKIITLPEDCIIHPGHGPVTTVGHEKKNNRSLRQVAG